MPRARYAWNARCTKASSAEFELTPEDVLATPLAPTTLAYTHYLLAVAYGRPFHEALAALLPCYWIYWEVGKELTRAGSPNPLYARWIGTYGSDEFGSVVRAVLDATNDVAAGSGMPSAPRCAATSRRRAATSGCSGTWAIAASAGRSDR